jgi:hypothetical protein
MLTDGLLVFRLYQDQTLLGGPFTDSLQARKAAEKHLESSGAALPI